MEANILYCTQLSIDCAQPVLACFDGGGKVHPCVYGAGQWRLVKCMQ
uniref:Uncharacterized protein n=1 Tax=Arundo donax TaxID=35708 RepID=A0A0A9AIR1_ARUDO